MRQRGIRRTYRAKPQELQKQWWIVDAAGQTLGRLASRLATVLMGKHRPEYTPHIDSGDFIVVTNASKIHVTGKKLEQKEYEHYTGYLGGRKVEKMSSLLERQPERIIRLAVGRMLPKTVLGRHMISKLKVYGGAEHPHTAQQPQPLGAH